jgi:hypothetical protein
MAGTHPITLDYKDLYDDPANNPFGVTGENREDCIQSLYEMWRAAMIPLKVESLL